MPAPPPDLPSGAPADFYAPLPLFVYGTLRSGCGNHAPYCFDAVRVVPAALAGRLYRLGDGYPAMADGPTGWVVGELLTFPDPAAALGRIDPLEGIAGPAGPAAGVASGDYRRVVRPAFPRHGGAPVPAWVYVLPGPAPRLAELVPGGDWVAFGGRPD